MPSKSEKKPVTSLLKSLKEDEEETHSDTLDVEEKREEISELERLRIELIKGAEDGDVPQSAGYIRKATEKAVRKMHAVMRDTEREKANANITDMIISNLAELLGGLDAISSPEELKKDLRGDALFKRDLTSGVNKIIPMIPLIGLISGGARTGSHIGTHYIDKWRRGEPSKTTEPNVDNNQSEEEEYSDEKVMAQQIKEITSRIVADIDDATENTLKE